MEKSTTISELAKALVKFQGEVKTIGYDAKNPFFKSEYATLGALVESTRELLSLHGLVVSQLTEETGAVTTILMHVSGEYLSSTLKLTPTKNDPQGLGSCITYSRRYAYAAILGLVSDKDDDGNHASQGETKTFKSPASIQRVVPLPKLSSEQEEILELGKKAFKGSKLNFTAWLGTNFMTNDIEKLDKEQLEKAKKYLTDAVIAQEGEKQ